MAQRSRSTAAGPMGFILGLGIVSMLGSIVCEAVLSVRGLSVAVLVGCYGGDLRVVLGAARCEGMGATECCSASKLPVDASTGSVTRSRCGALARCYAANDLRTIPLGSLRSR